MKYFRAVNIDNVTDVLYLSSTSDSDDGQVVAERAHIGNYGYALQECSKEEFEAMTQEINDYIINVGQDRDNVYPHASAHTEAEAIEQATKLRETWKCVEVVYMPCANEDINEIVWADYEK